MVTKAAQAKTNGVVTEDEFAITSWSKAKDYKKPFKFKCPTGQMTLLHRLDMSDLLRLGVAEDMDFMAKALMASEDTAKETDEKVKGKKPEEVAAETITKASNFAKLDKTINLVVQAGCLKPKLYLTPRDDAARQNGLMYVDTVPFEDRMAMFMKIFDSEGLITFREEQEDGVGDVADVSVVPLPAE